MRVSNLNSFFQLRFFISEFGELLRKRLDEEPGDRGRVLRGQISVLVLVRRRIVLSFVDAVL
jgi:hypothetical protein